MDPYSILGIRKGASANEIKKAYRRLARMHHPDKGGNEEMFKKIQNAYDILEEGKTEEPEESKESKETSTEIVSQPEGQVSNMIHKAKLQTINRNISTGTNPDTKLRRMGNFMVMKPLEPNMMDEYEAKMIKQRDGGIKRVAVGQAGFVKSGRYSM